MPGIKILRSFKRNPFLQPKSRTFDLLVNLYLFIICGNSFSHLPSYLKPPYPSNLFPS